MNIETFEKLCSPVINNIIDFKKIIEPEIDKFRVFPVEISNVSNSIEYRITIIDLNNSNYKEFRLYFYKDRDHLFSIRWNPEELQYAYDVGMNNCKLSEVLKVFLIKLDEYYQKLLTKYGNVLK